VRPLGIAIRLHGPLQAWGGPIFGDDRPTLSVPTRSGVLGLVAGCLGVDRSDVESLQALAEGTRVHVRVDAPGQLLSDAQTIQGCPSASLTRQTIQSRRDYLMGASFLAVVVPGDHAPGVGRVADALIRPKYAPYLGRRCCPPSLPLFVAPIVHTECDDATGYFNGLARAAVTAESWDQEPPTAFDYYLDVEEDPRARRIYRQRDVLKGPLSRLFGERAICHVRV
jgi:CRISPR system Cascade subunit CasD